MAHELPPLPYAYNALEPVIDEQTMRIHHKRHHAAYVDGLNQAIAGTPFENMDLARLLSRLYKVPRHIRGAVRNSGGGHANHSLFWKMMSPDGGGAPGGVLAAAIDRAFGRFEDFRETFGRVALGRFGSGWVWLVLRRAFGRFEDFRETFGRVALGRFGSGWVWLVLRLDGSLRICGLPSQDNPYMQTGDVPLLGLDLWEHAYYLKYQNRRADYVGNWWNIVDWEAVASRYEAALEQRKQQNGKA